MVPSVKLNNGADMPIIGFGTTFVSEAAVECALTTGFRLFDTAYDYGTEHVLGKVFQKWLRLKKISREELFVITKVPPHGNRPEGIEKYLRRSLQKLCLDYVDMYLIHWPVAFKEVGEEGKESLFPKDQDGNIMLDLSLNHIEVWRAMEAQVDAGRAKAIGLSNFNISQIQRILKAARIPPANLQCEIHIYHQQHELVDYCKKCGIVVCGYFPLGGHTITLFSASERWHQALIDEPVIRRLAEKYKKTPPQILIRYSIDRGVVTIFGCGNKPEYIAENFQVLTFKISHEDMLMLNRLDKGSEGRRVDLMFVSGLNTGADMPIVGFGTTFVTEEAVEFAMQIGFRHFDTAYVYETEAILGRVFGRWLKSEKVSREDLFIVTKLPPHGTRPEGVEKYLMRSLEKLGLDYVDMYLIHWPIAFKEDGPEGDEKMFPELEDGSIMLDMDVNHIEIWKAMEKQVDEGRAKAIGLSNFNISQIKRILKAARIPPANLQIELNVYLQQDDILRFCEHHRIVVCAYFALGGHTEHQVFPRRDNRGTCLLKDPAVRRLSKRYAKSPAQILLRYLIQRGIVTLVGCSNRRDFMTENIEAVAFQMSAQDMEVLHQLDKGPEARKGNLLLIKGISDHPEYPFEY